MSADYQLQDYGQMGFGQATQAPNCGYLQQIGPCWNYLSMPTDQGDYEIVIQQFGKDAEPRLNYGPKLRLLIAEPIKGIDLREAIHKLKIALKEAVK